MKKMTNKFFEENKPIGGFCNLPGVRKQEVVGYTTKNLSDIEIILEGGCVFVTADDNGSITIWKDDSGRIRGELQRFCVTLEERVFPSYSEIKIDDWLIKIQ